MLAALRAQLQELQVCPPLAGTLSTKVIVGTMTAEQMLCARVTNTIVLQEGVLVKKNEAN